MNKFLPLAAIFVLLSACGTSREECSIENDRVADLEAQLVTLQAELDDIKFGASRLLAQAKTAYEAKKDGEAGKVLSELLKRHPNAPESEEARRLLDQVEARVAAAELIRKKEQERKAQEERRAIAQATANMRKKTDEFNGVTWVTHRNAPVLGKYVSLYFGSRDNSAASFPIRMKIHYYGDDWLFVQSVTVKADDKVYELGALDFERDHSSGSIWEWTDVPVTNHEMLKDWMAAKRLVIRFNGNQYYHDFVVPGKQQAQIRDVYKAWGAMGGRP